MIDLFSPPGTPWVMLAPDYLRMKRHLILAVWSLIFVAATIASWLWLPWGWAPFAMAGFGAVWTAYRWWRQGRVYRFWGYAEREQDLYLRHGLMWRQLTVVPYGRMQVVEVGAGPIARAYGLATVRMVTASPATDPRIPGLTRSDAAALRDRLSEKGETQQAGL